MKIIPFARTLGSTRLCKISQEFGLLSNFSSLSKNRNACFGHCGPLGAKVRSKNFVVKMKKYREIDLQNIFGSYA